MPRPTTAGPATGASAADGSSPPPWWSRCWRPDRSRTHAPDETPAATPARLARRVRLVPDAGDGSVVRLAVRPADGRSRPGAGLSRALGRAALAAGRDTPARRTGWPRVGPAL